MSSAPQPQFHDAEVIGMAANVHKRTVLRRAMRERWPRKWCGNMLIFVPPARLRKECAELERVIRSGRAHYRPSVTDGLHSELLTPSMRAAAVRMVNRISAVLALAKAIQGGAGREAALVRVARRAKFNCSGRSLRRWFSAVARSGVAGLIERKRGRPAAKSEANA